MISIITENSKYAALRYLCVGLLGLVLFSSCKPAKDAEGAGDLEKPNILFIMSDDHTSQAGEFTEEFWRNLSRMRTSKDSQEKVPF